MRRSFLLLLAVCVLLCATTIAFLYFLPRVTFLVDSHYRETVLAVQQRKLFLRLLTKGYLLDVMEVSLEADTELLSNQRQRNGDYHIASPLVSNLLADNSICNELAIVGQGPGHLSTSFKRYWIEDASSMLEGYSPSSLLAVLALDGNKLSHNGYFPRDLVIQKQESETDADYVIRLKKVLDDRKVFILVAPTLGPWAIALLKDPSLQWIVGASYMHMVPKSQLQAVLIPDLEKAVTDLLTKERDMQTLSWTSISP
ncbi:MAG: hypothetical protein AB7D92_06990 [Sphaerochaeta sp.]